jgi:hypothetical protein
MVFKRKKDKPKPAPGTARMRGRDNTPDTQGAASGSVNNPLARRFQDTDEPDTIDLSQPVEFPETADSVLDEPTTRILAGGESKLDPSADDSPDDPVAGFLAVIAGPGRGALSTISYGMNSLGRDSSQRVSLNHGDPEISRENHCTVTFDSLSRKFYIQPGDGRRLAYLDDEPVLAPIRLTSGSHIRLGSTVLRFVALCGDDFSWEDQENA